MQDWVKISVFTGRASRRDLRRMKGFRNLRLWLDPVKRPGPEAMAVDEWLLETAELPVLRVYGWLGDWGSVGYFGGITKAQTSFPGLDIVRRWTGGGTVDHRVDWTYSVVVPTTEKLAGRRGAESYRVMHAALAEALTHEGGAVRLSLGNEETGAALCFENPVGYDLVDVDGQKIAGAGQRRTRRGLLHQGSVAGACDLEISQTRARRLAECLAVEWETRDFSPPSEVISSMVRARYGVPSWSARR
ncbi:MAG: hypothetical protein H8M99_00320 [Gloeobacteraceae cyanobacterium ES-bin-144]|nr:hypothetical protein [Verrucomicrobiales bacterium]